MTNLRRRMFLGMFLLILPVQMFVSRLWSEPYPALYQPSFASSAKADNVLVVVVPEVDARFNDGRRESFSHIELVGDVQTSELTIFDAGLSTEGPVDDLETVRWLYGRLHSLSGAVPTSATIRWRRYEQAISEDAPRSIETTQQVDVDFGVLDAS